MKNVLVSLVLFISLAGSKVVCGDAEEGRGGEHSVFISGDTLLAWSVNQSAFEHGPEYLFRGIRELVRGADVAVTNLEGVVTAEGAMFPKESKPFLFRSHPITINALVDAGFDVVTTSNNHSIDYGRRALLSEHELLGMANMAFVGSGKNRDEARLPLYVQVGDKIVAFINFYNDLPRAGATHEKAGTFYVKRDPESARGVLEPIIKEAKRHADLVIVTPHWGVNWRNGPKDAQRELARGIIDWGADAFFGHHAHQLQGMEIYKGKFIVYDMGNLISDGAFVKNRPQAMGYLLHFDDRGIVRLEVHAFRLSNDRVSFADKRLRKRSLDRVAKLSEALSPGIELVKVENHLEVRTEPESSGRGSVERPARVFVPNRTRRLPSSVIETPPNVVSRELPGWKGIARAVKMEGAALDVVDVKLPDHVHPKYGFTAEVALKVTGELRGEWNSYVRCVDRKTKKEQVLERPVLNGEWPVGKWRVGDVVRDTFLVRLSGAGEGAHDVYWGMTPSKRPKKLFAKEQKAQGPRPGEIEIGEISFREKDVPRNIAGLHWSGKKQAPPSRKAFAATQDKEESRTALILVLVGSGVGLMVLVAAAFLLIRRRRRSFAPDYD